MKPRPPYLRLRRLDLWFNFVIAALALLELKVDLLQPLLPVNVYTAIAIGLPIANLFLRIMTMPKLGLDDGYRQNEASEARADEPTEPRFPPNQRWP